MLSAHRPARAIGRWQTYLIGAVLFRALTSRGEVPTKERPRENGASPLGDPFDPGRGPTTAAWREEAITRANELQGLATWVAAHPDDPATADTELLAYVREHLAAARTTAAQDDEPTRRWWSRMFLAWGGAAHQRTLGNLDAVEATLLRMAPMAFVRGEMPSLLAHVNRFLPKGDPRQTRVARLAVKAEAEPLTPAERGAVVNALHAANTQRRRDLLRVRSFRNVMYGTAAVLCPLAVLLALFGASRPTAIPLCFYPEEMQKVVCPTEEIRVTARSEQNAQQADRPVDIDPYIARAAKRGDILLLEIIGLIAAVVASVVALRNIRGTSTPYGLAVALALVKVPLGALTAVLGLLLMSGGFVPGLSALDSSAQILAWGLVFGFSQQLLTRLVDQRANTLLDNVGGRGAAGDRG